HDIGSRISAARPEAFRLVTDRHSDVGYLPELEIRRSDANDGEALIVERELFPDNAWILTEPATPESVTQDRRRRRVRTVLFRQKVAPQQRLDAQGGEEFRRDEPPLQAFRFAGAGEIETLVPTHRHH